jgi:hypothetical protein
MYQRKKLGRPPLQKNSVKPESFKSLLEEFTRFTPFNRMELCHRLSGSMSPIQLSFFCSGRNKVTSQRALEIEKVLRDLLKEWPQAEPHLPKQVVKTLTSYLEGLIDETFEELRD